MEQGPVNTFSEPDMVWVFRSTVRSLIVLGQSSCNVPPTLASAPLGVRQVIEAAETMRSAVSSWPGVSTW